MSNCSTIGAEGEHEGRRVAALRCPWPGRRYALLGGVLEGAAQDRDNVGVCEAVEGLPPLLAEGY